MASVDTKPQASDAGVVIGYTDPTKMGLDDPGEPVKNLSREEIKEINENGQPSNLSKRLDDINPANAWMKQMPPEVLQSLKDMHEKQQDTIQLAVRERQRKDKACELLNWAFSMVIENDGTQEDAAIKEMAKQANMCMSHKRSHRAGMAMANLVEHRIKTHEAIEARKDAEQAELAKNASSTKKTPTIPPKPKPMDYKHLDVALLDLCLGGESSVMREAMLNRYSNYLYYKNKFSRKLAIKSFSYPYMPQNHPDEKEMFDAIADGRDPPLSGQGKTNQDLGQEKLDKALKTMNEDEKKNFDAMDKQASDLNEKLMKTVNTMAARYDKEQKAKKIEEGHKKNVEDALKKLEDEQKKPETATTAAPTTVTESVKPVAAE